MRLLLVHASSLLYSEIFLRLERPSGWSGSRERPGNRPGGAWVLRNALAPTPLWLYRARLGFLFGSRGF